MHGINYYYDTKDEKNKYTNKSRWKLSCFLKGDNTNIVKIISLYMLVSISWILISDKIISYFLEDIANKYRLFLKGACLVIMSVITIYHHASRNIRKIKDLEHKVNIYQNQYEFVINNTTDGIWDWNVVTNQVMLPVKWKERLGYGVNEIPDTVMAWENLIHPEDYEWVTETLNDYISKKTLEYNVEYRMVKRDGSIVWIQDAGQAIWDADGKPLRMCGTHTDISARKEAEKLLFRMMEENQQLLSKSLEHERLQTEFFANISHEFKTPLNVILGTIQLLDYYTFNSPSEFDPKQLTKWLPIMKQNCFRLLRLINNLLDITKLDSNAFSIKYSNYDIIHVVEEITQSIAVLAQNKGITITFDTNVEEKIMACDINIIERIILNLLSNAIKYTDVGKDVFVSIFDEKENIIISVKDTGLGIPRDKLETIFERFRQIDGALYKKAEGSGIGLSLVKSLVCVLNGEISVQSTIGEGSQFNIKLPVNILEEDSIDLNNNDYNKNLVEKITVEFSDIYTI